MVLFGCTFKKNITKETSNSKKWRKIIKSLRAKIYFKSRSGKIILLLRQTRLFLKSGQFNDT